MQQPGRAETLTRVGASVLANLRHSGPLSMTTLAAIEGLQPQSLTRPVNALAEAGFLTRSRDEEDRRQQTIAITESGRVALAEHLHDGTTWLAAALRDTLTPAERAILRVTGLSLVCAVAPSIEVHNSARICQGVAGAAGMVVSRAVITDLYIGTTAAKKFSALGAITSAAPILAPVLGGTVLAVSAWRTVFVVLAVIGAIQVLGVLAWVPDTAPRRNGRKCPLRTPRDPVRRTTAAADRPGHRSRLVRSPHRPAPHNRRLTGDRGGLPVPREHGFRDVLSCGDNGCAGKRSRCSRCHVRAAGRRPVPGGRRDLPTGWPVRHNERRPFGGSSVGLPYFSHGSGPSPRAYRLRCFVRLSLRRLHDPVSRAEFARVHRHRVVGVSSRRGLGHTVAGSAYRTRAVARLRTRYGVGPSSR
nr:MFS transporter [Kibdelosporangium phytohabitans]